MAGHRMDSAVRKQRQDGLTEGAFARLLQWLDHDRESAGQKYEVIRLRLIKIFQCRGSSVPEELADATVDRVAAKLGDIAGIYVGDPALYFYNVAEKIYLEYGRKVKSQLPLPANLAEAKHAAAIEAQAADCLEHCMQMLSEKNRELILAYYGYERPGRDKLQQRKALAERLAIGDKALWIRVHRIREALKKCVSSCMETQPAFRFHKEIDDSTTKQQR